MGSPCADSIRLVRRAGLLVLQLALLVPATGLTVPPLRLGAPRSYVTGPLPSQAIPADLDDDTDLDVIVRSSDPFGPTTLQLFRNPGDGSLVLQNSVPAAGAERLTAADFNADGRLDLAQAYKSDGAGGLAVYLRTGSFVFGQTTQSLSYRPGRVAAGNLDGAGGLDLAIADYDLPRVYIYAGDGAGGFTLLGTYDTDSSGATTISDMVCSDLDGDGRSDLVVAHYAPPGAMQTDKTSWLPNLGGGTFGAARVILDGWSGELATADLDGDGDTDVLTTGTALTGPDLDSLVLLRNAGQGTFGPAERFATGSGSLWVIGLRLADVDSDGDLDAGLLFSDAIPGNPNDKPTARWSLVRNDGSAHFAAPEFHPTGAAPLDLAFADLDGVHGPEALTAAADDARLIVHYNESGQYSAPQIIPVQDPQATLRGTEVTDIAVGDVNNDGHIDLAVIGGNSGLAGEGPDTLFVVNGAVAGLSPVPQYIDLPHRYPSRILARQIAGPPATDLAVIFTGDSLLDPAKGAGLSLGVTGGLPAAMQFQGFAGAPSGVASFDYNGDDIRDLAVFRLPGTDGLTCRISVLTVSGTGALTYVGDLTLGSDDPLVGDARQSYAIGSGDMDGDGIEDLVAVSWPIGANWSVLSVILHKGGNSFQVREYTTLGPTVSDVQAADLTGDGLPEVLLTRVPALTEGGDGELLVYPNTGVGSLGLPASYNAGTGPTRARAAQMDGLPGLDLVVSGDAGNEVTLLLNDGAGAFPVQERYMPAGGADALVVGDFDFDADIDVAVLNVEHVFMPDVLEYRSTVSVLLNRLHGLPGDIDGDGLCDVVDLLYLVDAFGSVSGDANYDPRADFNSDSAVDVVDLLVLVENFGKY